MGLGMRGPKVCACVCFFLFNAIWGLGLSGVH